MRFGAYVLGTSVLVMATTLTAASPVAATCDDVIYRIWQNGNSTFYDQGTEVPLEIGKEAHFYLHYRSKSPSPYSTSADLGYPRPMGLTGPPAQKILEVVGLRAQSSKDVADGRIILKGTKDGRATLGYKMREVRHPGTLDQVPASCRTGVVQFKIGDGGSQARPRPTPPAPAPPAPVLPAMKAASELTNNLYEGILRRPGGSGHVPEGQVNVVYERGHAGLVDLAVDMVKSKEFRENAFERTIAAHSDLGANSRDQEVLSRLLTDIYRTLYGRGASVEERDHERNLDAIDVCLSSFSSREQACEDLGRALVTSGAYIRHHQGDLNTVQDAIGERGGIIRRR